MIEVSGAGEGREAVPRELVRAPGEGGNGLWAITVGDQVMDPVGVR